MSTSLFETVWSFNGRSVSFSASWSSRTGDEVSLRQPAGRCVGSAVKSRKVKRTAPLSAGSA